MHGKRENFQQCTVELNESSYIDKIIIITKIIISQLHCFEASFT